jgi:O-antigen/teichoic acid export membrane protein
MSSDRSYLQDTLLLTLSAVIGRVFGVLGLLATLKVFPSSVYGTWLLVLTFTNFLLPLATLRLEIPLVLAKSERVAKGLLSGILALILGLTALLAVFVLIAPERAVYFVTGLDAQADHLLPVAVPAFVLLSSQSIFQALFLRLKQFYALAVFNLIVPVFSLAMTLILPFYFNATAELAAFIFLSSLFFGILGSLLFGKTAFRKILHSLDLTKGKLAQIAASVRRHRVYPTYMLPYSLSSAVTERVLLLIITLGYSTEVMATFYVARQLLSGAASVITGALRSAFFGHSAREVDFAHLRIRALLTLKTLSYLLAPVLAFSVFWLEDAVALIAQDDWRALPTMSWYLMFPTMILIFTGPLERVFDIAGRQKLSVSLQLASDICMITVISLVAYYSNKAEVLVLAVSTVLVIYNVIWLCFALSVISVEKHNIASVIVRFLVVFTLCLIPHLLIDQIDARLPAFGFSLAFLLVTIVPGLLAIVSAIPRLNSFVPQRMLQMCGRMP